jgi:hypothetical protein
MPMSQREVEMRLNLVCLEISRLQDSIWELLESLERAGILPARLEEYAGEVMREVSFWVDQCTLAAQSPPVLLRRMEVHLSRLVRLRELLEEHRRAGRAETA